MFADIMSIISLVFSTASTLIVGFMTYKIGKFSNLEAIHKYQKKITAFELQFKTKEWFLDIIENSEFNNYDENSKALMMAWWYKINEQKVPKEIKVATRAGRGIRGNIPRVPTLPTTKGGMFSTGIPVEVVVPNSDITNRGLEELREQYYMDSDDFQPTNFRKVELGFDDILAAELELRGEEQK